MTVQSPRNDVLNNLDAGSYLITARAEGRSGSLVRRAFIAIDNGRRIVVLIRDFDAWLQINGPNATPTFTSARKWCSNSYS